jgi:hypothetical protein
MNKIACVFCKALEVSFDTYGLLLTIRCESERRKQFGGNKPVPAVRCLMRLKRPRAELERAQLERQHFAKPPRRGQRLPVRYHPYLAVYPSLPLASLFGFERKMTVTHDRGGFLAYQLYEASRNLTALVLAGCDISSLIPT